MAVSNTTPLTFDLPDGDHVELCTWPYIISMLTEPLESITSSIESINVSLGKIEDKVDEWLGEN